MNVLEPGQLLIAVFTGVLALVAVLQLGILTMQWLVYRKQAGIMAEQAKLMREALEETRKANELAKSGYDVARTASDAAATSANALMSAERAYVAISHYLPGVEIDEIVVEREGQPAMQGVTIRLRVENCGNTPATVTDVSYALIVAPNLPQAPSKLVSKATTAFLVKGGSVDVVLAEGQTPEHLDAVQRGRTKLWVVIAVDYIDQFKRHHRGGYGHVYAPIANEGASNLVFLDAPGFNYDRVREYGDGGDWVGVAPNQT